MNRLLRFAAQGVLYAGLALVLAIFSHWPSYQHLGADRALIKLSLSHQGKRLADCETLRPEELARLPPNMRAPTRCPRERSELAVEIEIDGALVLRETAAPSGLSRDGAAVIYRRFELPAGRHRIAARLKDDARRPGFAYHHEAEVELAPAEVLVIDFDSARQEIVFQ